MKTTRLPARDGKTPSNYVQNSKGEIWYKPLPSPKPSAQVKQKAPTAETVGTGEKKTS